MKLICIIFIAFISINSTAQSDPVSQMNNWFDNLEKLRDESKDSREYYSKYFYQAGVAKYFSDICHAIPDLNTADIPFETENELIIDGTLHTYQYRIQGQSIGIGPHRGLINFNGSGANSASVTIFYKMEGENLYSPTDNTFRLYLDCNRPSEIFIRYVYNSHTTTTSTLIPSESKNELFSYYYDPLEELLSEKICTKMHVLDKKSTYFLITPSIYQKAQNQLNSYNFVHEVDSYFFSSQALVSSRDFLDSIENYPFWPAEYLTGNTFSVDSEFKKISYIIKKTGYTTSLIYDCTSNESFLKYW